MDQNLTSEQIERLVLEVVVRRLMRRALRNHPRAFEGGERELDDMGPLPIAARAQVLSRLASLARSPDR